MARRNPILVTGAHRSGTTWVGRMLALAPGVAYIHEPFSPVHRPGLCRASFPHWYTYITSENAARFEDGLRDCMDLRYAFRAELMAVRSLRDAARMCRDQFTFWRARRALVKDPIALFSSEWLASRFDMQVVVLIRHPAAFVASMKRAGWSFDFHNFLAQPSLMQGPLREFSTAIEKAAKDPGDWLTEAILLWNVLYAFVHRLRLRNSTWTFLRHEDLALRPLDSFAALYTHLGLSWTKRVESEILAHSQAPEPALDHAANVIRRDSEQTVRGWRRILTEEEIDSIREGTSKVSAFFYHDADWR